MKTQLTVLALALSLRAAAAPVDNWPLSYEGKSTNAFIWDPNAAALVRSRVPKPLAGDVLAALGGPPEPVFVVEKRYVSVAACVPHSCMEKGFFWIDTQSGSGLGAYILDGKLRLGSSNLAARQIPPPARRALLDWMSANSVVPTSIEFIGPGDARSSIDPSTLTPPAPYQPAPGGPSYNCAKASTRTEKAICSSSSLSALDLKLAQLVTELRDGHDTAGAREQLRDFQRKWLKERDDFCTQSTDIVACLEQQYQVQHERLMHWIPKH